VLVVVVLDGRQAGKPHEAVLVSERMGVNPGDVPIALEMVVKQIYDETFHAEMWSVTQAH